MPNEADLLLALDGQLDRTRHHEVTRMPCVAVPAERSAARADLVTVNPLVSVEGNTVAVTVTVEFSLDGSGW